MYESPEYRNTNTIEGFILTVKNTLQLWLDVHTNPEAWAGEWLMGCDAEYTFREAKGKLENDYFSFDWKTVAYRQWAKQNVSCWVRCSGCGALWESWAFDCDCEEDIEGGEIEDWQDLACWAEDIEIVLDESSLLESLKEDGFRVYRQALEPVTRGIEEEIGATLDAFGRCVTGWDYLTWAREATRIYHVNGEVIQDYGERLGLEYNQVDSIRDNGFVAWFDKEDLREFMDSDVVL
jgi:hypothetical protein